MNSEPIIEKSEIKLLGFRTNKVWKKILSVIYLVFCALLALGSLTDGRYEKITVFDFCIDKLYSVILLLMFLSPYVFLSNTKFRDKLPLFKKHNGWMSTVGMIIVILVIAILSGFVNDLHSKEYLSDMENHAYIEVSKKEAACEVDGKIEYHCEYCGIDTTETVKAKGHTMKQISADEEKIVHKCEICGKEETELLEKKTTESNTSTANSSTESQTESKAETSSENVSSKTETVDTMITQFKDLGFTDDEANKMKEIFTTVGITDISNIQAVGNAGIDNLQAFKSDIFDSRADKGGISIHFTIDKRQLCFISLDGIATTKVDYAYINIFGNVKFKTSNGKKSVTLYDKWDENGEIDNNSIGYKAVLDYENKKIVNYE